MTYFQANPSAKDSMWWKDGKVITDVVFGIFDTNHNDQINETQFASLMEWLIPDKYGIDRRVDDLLDLISLEHNEFTRKVMKSDCATLIEQFLQGVLSPVQGERPWWWDETDQQLYGGIREDMRKVVLSHDQDHNNKVTLREFLQAIQSS